MISATFVINVTVGFIVGAYVAMTIPGFKPAVYQTLSAIRKTTSGMFAQITTSKPKPKPKRVQTPQEFSEHEFSEDEGSD
jgi:hypothetical protein